MQPMFVITYGPPGCGKSIFAKKFYSDYVIIDVDDIVANMEGFLTQSQNICNMIIQGINREEVEKEAHYIYQSFRDEADRRSESLLRISLNDKKNIVFETTGGSHRAISYLKETIISVKKQGYRVRIVFPHAPVSILGERIYQRGKSSGRLPSLSFLQSAYNYACESFKEVASMCDEVFINDVSGEESVNIYHQRDGYFWLLNIEKVEKLPSSLYIHR